MRGLFDGDTYEAVCDYQRLVSLLGRVWRLMADGRWRTLREIQQNVGGSESSISARLRDFRKDKFGGYIVLRRRRSVPTVGLWEYRLMEPTHEQGSRTQSPLPAVARCVR